MIKVIGLSRVHITLFDVEGKYGRLDGGMGVGLKFPRVVVREGNCRSFEVEGVPKVGYCVEEDYEEHVGLGHTTQFLLALGKLAFESSFTRKSAVEIAKLLGRGSTSGVGVHVFEVGGFVVDGGHSKKVKKEFLPSDFSRAPPPPLLMRVDFPWYIYVNVPRGGRRIFGKEELQAFKEAKVEGVDALMRVAFMEFVPSVVEGDLDGVLEALDVIQGLGFKRVEWELQTEEVRSLSKAMRSKGFPNGLSSFGPAIFTFCKKRECEELKSTFGGFYTEPNNEGAKVVWS